jgi:hypothetical protein
MISPGAENNLVDIIPKERFSPGQCYPLGPQPAQAIKNREKLLGGGRREIANRVIPKTIFAMQVTAVNNPDMHLYRHTATTYLRSEKFKGGIYCMNKLIHFF